MTGIDRTLTQANKEHFTQNVTQFRNDIQDSLRRKSIDRLFSTSSSKTKILFLASSVVNSIPVTMSTSTLIPTYSSSAAIEELMTLWWKQNIKHIFYTFNCVDIKKQRERERKATTKRHNYFWFYIFFFFHVLLESLLFFKMYTIRREPHNSYNYSQSWTVQIQQQQQQQLMFYNRQMIKSKQQTFWSTKFSLSDSQCVKAIDFSTGDEPLPVYRAPCTFQNSLETTRKGFFSSFSRLTFAKLSRSESFRRSSNSPSNCCVPDVYSPGSISSGNCSPPPPSSNLPAPPSEWLH